MDRHATIPLREALGWYDVLIEAISPVRWQRRVAGRVDIGGRETTSDPFIRLSTAR